MTRQRSSRGPSSSRKPATPRAATTPGTPVTSRGPVALDATAASPDALDAALRDGLPDSTSGGAPWHVRRVWPADLADPTAGYVLELERDGERRGATWDEHGVHLQLADPRLPALAEHLADGWRVIGHRPAKRAVLRTPQGTFLKLARPRATQRALDTMAEVEHLLSDLDGAPGLPELLHGAADDGTLELAAAPGHPLDEALADATEEQVDALAAALAEVLLGLASIDPVPPRRGRHAAETPAGSEGTGRDGAVSLDAELPTHSLADEAAILHRWADAAPAQAPLHAEDRRTLEDGVATVAAQLRQRAVGDARPGTQGTPPIASRAWGLAHRDLHEGQILVSDAGAERDEHDEHDAREEREERGAGTTLTILDWDTAAFAHPATDLANLLAHLDRLARREQLPHATVARFRRRLLSALEAGWHPATSTEGREVLALLEEATRLRLIAVHGFRTPASERA